MQHNRPPQIEARADAGDVLDTASAQLLFEDRIDVLRENAAARQFVAIPGFREKRFTTQFSPGAFYRVFERQLLVSMEGVVVNEDADRALCGQKTREPIDHGSKTFRVTPIGERRARRHQPLVIVFIVIFEYYIRVTPNRSGPPREASAVDELQTFKASFFRALGNPARIRILELLVRGGRTVQELQQALELEQPLVSQQLAVLRNHGIVTAEKTGLSVRYALRDPLVGDLLDVARRIFNNHLVGTQGLLRELQREARRAQ